MKKLIGIILVLLITAPAFASGNYTLDLRYKKSLDSGCSDVKIKSVKTATMLGLLPGGGSFYTRQVPLGIIDLFLWPFSPAWDMPLAHKRASELNKEETIHACEFSGKI